MVFVEYPDDLIKASNDPRVAGALAGGDGPFDRPEWWHTLARECGLAPFPVLACNGTATALLALSKSAGTITSMANWYTFRWRPLVTPGADPAPLLEAITRDLHRHGWRVTIDHMPDEDGSATRFAAALDRAGWNVRCEADDTNHILRVAGRSYAQFLAARPGPLRTTLKRRSGKAACRIFTSFDSEAWRQYEDIYAASWKPQEGSPAFLAAFARDEGAAGRLRLGLADIDGRPVAAQFWTVENGTAYIHKLAHREDARGLSPGTVLSAALFRHVIDEDGVGLIDFGTGDNSYKRDWMDDIRPRYRVDALWPWAPQAWPRLAARLLRG